MILALAPHPAVDRLLEVTSLERGAIHRPIRVVSVPGGKGLNAARAARTLGADVEAIALLGGFAGRWIARELRRLGVGACAVWAREETRTCTSILSVVDGRLTEFYEGGAAVDSGLWARFARRASTAMRPGPIVCLSGSLPPGAPSSGWRDLADCARAAGARVLVDVAGPPLLACLEAAPWIVKVNRAEAAAVTGVDAAGEAAVRLVEMGARTAIVTEGPKGCAVADASGTWLCSAGPGGPYTVGCGDAFLGGLAAALDRGDGLESAMRLASACASANAARPGPGVLDAGTISTHLASIGPLEALAGRTERTAWTGP